MCRCAGRLAWCPSSELAGRWEWDGSERRNRVAGSGEDATGSISADGQVGTDDRVLEISCDLHLSRTGRRTLFEALTVQGALYC